MRRKPLSAGVAIATALAVGGPSHAQSQIDHNRMGHGHMSHGSAADHGDHGADGAIRDDPVIAAFQAVNDRMHRAMDIAFTGDADVDFVRGMIPHHQGAIDMAHVVLAHGSDPGIRALAQEVIAAQQAEIALMRDWLAARGLD